jgi:hypothetical protein
MTASIRPYFGGQRPQPAGGARRAENRFALPPLACCSEASGQAGRSPGNAPLRRAAALAAGSVAALAGRGRVLALAAALLFTVAAQAAPGAHGPNGEHLDAPAAGSGAALLPRLQAQSEAFELVAELKGGELVVFVDRYATNEPVLEARLEVESSAHKALAVFRPERGDYAATGAGLLAALAAPGEHPLVFTLTAGAESDLLDGTLIVAAADHGHGHSHAVEYAAIGGAVVLALLVGGAVLWRWRHRRGPWAVGGAR